MRKRKVRKRKDMVRKRKDMVSLVFGHRKGRSTMLLLFFNGLIFKKIFCDSS